MKKRPKKTEEPVDEGWLLPYADMLTLLLALFIVMFAMAKTDDSKLDELSNEFNIIFNGKNPNGSDGILPGHPPKKDKKTTTDSSLIESEDSKSKKNDEKKTEENTSESSEETTNSDVERMKTVGNSIKSNFSKEGLENDIDVDLEQDGLRIAISSGLLFAPGSATVTSEVEEIVKKIAESLQDLDNDIIIAGYTDNVPNNNSNYESNWELSSARAMTVMKLLVKHHGIEEDRVSVLVYVEFKPKAPNNNDENRAKNRRVEIFVVKKDRD